MPYKKDGCCCRYKNTPRSQQTVHMLQMRLNRMIGQLNGIKKMLDDNRYCGDILIQIAAVENALQKFGYLVLKDHMETCVAEEIRKLAETSGSEAKKIVEVLRKTKSLIDSTFGVTVSAKKGFSEIVDLSKQVMDQEFIVKKAISDQYDAGKQVLVSLKTMNELTSTVKQETEQLFTTTKHIESAIQSLGNIESKQVE